jgi:hypothetical protein
VFPAAIAVTNPAEVTLAAPVLLFQLPPGMLAEKVIVSATHKLVVPDKVAVSGNGSTVRI